MYQPSVSVVVNTHNRADHLKRLLDCLAHQTYENFEVIVVNGPSTDHTEQVLESYQGAIRVEHCPEVNLCMSRNIGVYAAAGDIVAFIDDDAVPGNVHWLEEGCKPFKNEKIGVVGGESYRLNGQHEFCNGSFSIWGENTPLADDSLSEEELDGERYNGVIGCNCFFRRSAVLEVGGFDEYYAYFLDETDLCLRIAQAGYKIAHHNRALVYHEAAGGANRKSEYHLNWDVISKSRGYFVIKASEHTGLSKEERERRAIASCDGWMKDFKWLLSEKKISKEDYSTFVSAVNNGVRAGIQAGFQQERRLQFNHEYKQNAFKKYEKAIGLERLNLCYFCEDDVITPRGGVAVYTDALAKGLTKRGHNVYVITKGTEDRLRNINGINYCTVVPENVPINALVGYGLPQERLNFSYACFIKLQQLISTFCVQVVESPLWDSYGLVTSYLEKKIPMATRLQTPLKMLLETKQATENADIDLLMEYEAAMMEHSDHIITISDCVRETIEELYEMKFQQPVHKNYLGIKPDVLATTRRQKGDGKIVVFFIGRLERRKGIDSIIASIPALMENYPDLEFRLAGDCNIVDEVIGDTYRNKLLKENKGAKWLKRVKFLGKISDEEKEQEFADCDVFVSPSLYESFGIIFIEAMRYAKPVIGCNVGGMKEVVANGETGLLCEPGNAQSFADCLERLIKDEMLRHMMGQAGLERLHRMFTEETMCEGALKIYREMIEMHQKP